jgi:hypothetical protein
MDNLINIKRVAMDWTSVDGKTTHVKDIFVDGKISYGASFSGFDGLTFGIDPDKAGTIDLGNSKLTYSDVNLWRFQSGTYKVTGSDNHEWYFFDGSPQTVVVNGGEGIDSYVFGQWPTGLSKIYLKDYVPYVDEILISNDGKYSVPSLAEIAKKLSVIHSGSGNNAITKINIPTRQKGGVTEVYIPGHLAIDSLRIGNNELYSLYLMSATIRNSKIYSLDSPLRPSLGDSYSHIISDLFVADLNGDNIDEIIYAARSSNYPGAVYSEVRTFIFGWDIKKIS